MEVNFDALLMKYIGEFGLYQILMVSYLGYLGFSCIFDYTEIIFQAGIPDFWCALPNLPTYIAENLTQSQIRTLGGVPDSLYDGQQCQIVSHDYSNIQWEDIGELLESNYTINTDGIVTQQCADFVYSEEELGNTIVVQWDLVCDRKWLAALPQSLFMAGLMVGNILFGSISDRFGRRPTIRICLVGVVLTRIAMGLAPNYVMFVVFKALLAVFTMGHYNSSYILCIESAGIKYRAFIKIITTVSTVFGGIFMCGVAYAVRDWSIRTHIFTTFSIPLLITFWFLPESARWTFANGQPERGYQLIKSMAKINKKELPDDLTVATDNKANKSTVVDLMRTPNIRKLTFVVCFLWMVCVFLYYALTLNAANMPGGLYLNMILSWCVDLPGKAITSIMIYCKVGRKNILLMALTGGGTMMLLGAIVPKGVDAASITLYFLGKMCMTVVFLCTYIYTPEAYPTVLRNIALGTGSMSGRFAGIMAPFVAMLGRYSPVLPVLIMGVIALCGAMVTLLLPETKGKPLPQTIEEGEKNSKLMSFAENLPCKSNQHPHRQLVPVLISDRQIPDSLASKFISPGEKAYENGSGLMKQ